MKKELMLSKLDERTIIIVIVAAKLFPESVLVPLVARREHFPIADSH